MNKLDPDKAYVASDLYLPKSRINEQHIRNSLILKEGRKKHKLYSETSTHIIVPRYHIPTEQYDELDCEFIKLPKPKFPHVSFTSSILLRENQKLAWDRLKEQDDGILNLAPGKGKTILALHKMAQLKVPTLIIVNTGPLVSQWTNFIRDPEFLDFHDIGYIGDGLFDWEYPIVIALIQSLYSKPDKLPKGFKEHFGFMIVDEGHHLGGIEFGKIGPICQGSRLLLSATYKRVDGREDIYRQYFGPIIYSDKGFDLKPTIKVIELDTRIVEEEHPEKVATQVAQDKRANLLRANYIKKYSQDRKSILVSTRVDQLKALHDLFPNSALIVSDTPKETRIPLLKKSKLSFIIDNFGIEGLDCEELDTLFILLPISVNKMTRPDGTMSMLGNDLLQIMGRILRVCDSKQEPLVIIFDDIHVEPLHKQVSFIKTWLKTNDYQFEVIK